MFTLVLYNFISYMYSSFIFLFVYLVIFVDLFIFKILYILKYMYVFIIICWCTVFILFYICFVNTAMFFIYRGNKSIYLNVMHLFSKHKNGLRINCTRNIAWMGELYQLDMSPTINLSSFKDLNFRILFIFSLFSNVRSFIHAMKISAK